MYEVNKVKEKGYVESYIYKTKNKAGQIMSCNISWSIEGFFYVCFYVTTKRKDGFQKLETTGKDGISTLIWAKKCIIDFIKFGKDRYKGKSILIYADDRRRRDIYRRSLIPLGFEIAKLRHEPLIYKF